MHVEDDDTIEDFGDKSALGQFYYSYMKILAVAGYAWLLVSGIHILRKKTSEGVSVFGLTMYMSLSVSFLAYGILKHDDVVIMASVVAILCNLFVLSTIFIVNYPAWSKKEIDRSMTN